MVWDDWRDDHMKDELTIMSALRVPPNAQLVVEAAGGRFESLSEVSDSALRQQLLAAVGELVVFAGGYQALVDAGVAPALIQRAPKPVARNVDTDELGSAFLAPGKDQYGSEKESSPGAKASKPKAKVDGEGQTEVLLNLAEEIDVILQRNLTQHPILSSRSIHLETDPEGLILIEVDGRFYRSLDEIHDQQVKDAIAQARREWERR